MSEITALSRRFNVSERRTQAAIERGTSVPAFRAAILDTMASREAEQTRANSAVIGMSRREVRQFSILNAIRYLENPTRATREAAAFEIEASNAAAQKMRKDPGGLFIPPDVLMSSDFVRNTQNTGAAAAGGNLVATNLMAGSFIDMLRNRIALAGAGVRILSGLVGNVDIPKQTGGSTAYWIGEGDDVDDSVSTFGLVSLTPHTVGIATPITRRMLKQGTPDIETLVRADLISSAALAVDQAGLNGHSSADAPNSLRAAILSSAVTWAAGMPDFEEVVQLETEVAAENADFGSMSYIYNARMSGHLKTTPIFAPESGRPVEGETGIVNGYARQKSNQVRDGEIFFGNWSDLIIGMWSGLDLRVDTATLAKSDGMVLRAFQDVDVAIRHTESFSLGKPV